MFIGMLIVLTAGCLMLTVSLYEVFRKSPMPLSMIAKLIEMNPLISFAFNFAVSFVLTLFIGVGMVAGAANLTASIIFAIYVIARKKSAVPAKPVKHSTISHESHNASVDFQHQNQSILVNNTQASAKSQAAGEILGKAVKKGTAYGLKAGKVAVKGGAGFVRGIVRGLRSK
jgi:hypothetical protein